MLKNHKVWFSFSDGDKDISYGPFSLSENDGQSQTDGLALPVSQLLPLFNTWPATAVSARYDESKNRSMDDGLPGLGDLDCEILADAAEDMVISALCHSTDLTYIDPRPKERQEKDAAHQNTMTISTSSEAHEKESEEWVGVIDPTGTSHRLSWYNGNQMSIYLILKVKSTT
ncbi:uncharacterized protein L203_100832 [Cryptococcus depauperatus CBS 7841]|uniref:Uncharacterized protein n=1 Tax=Cryptococcus depauperatus CBS 7841 TaxID=1295531 RepID=A0AAJ8JNT0_9TREE